MFKEYFREGKTTLELHRSGFKIAFLLAKRS